MSMVHTNVSMEEQTTIVLLNEQVLRMYTAGKQDNTA